MALYSLELGDWSTDGHGISKVLYAEVTGDVTVEDLAKNYTRLTTELGFSPSDIAEGYDDQTIKAEYVEKLRAAGFQFSESEDDAEMSEYGAIVLVTYQDYEGYYGPGAKPKTKTDWFVDENSLRAITMFFFTHDLPGVTWQPVEIKATELIHHVRGQIGYGLYRS